MIPVSKCDSVSVAAWDGGVVSLSVVGRSRRGGSMLRSFATFRAFAAAARRSSWHDRDRLLRVFAGIEMITILDIPSSAQHTLYKVSADPGSEVSSRRHVS